MSDRSSSELGKLLNTMRRTRPVRRIGEELPLSPTDRRIKRIERRIESLREEFEEHPELLHFKELKKQLESLVPKKAKAKVDIEMVLKDIFQKLTAKESEVKTLHQEREKLIDQLAIAQTDKEIAEERTSKCVKALENIVKTASQGMEEDIYIDK